MLPLAQLSQVAQALGILQRFVPLLGARQEYRDRLERPPEPKDASGQSLAAKPDGGKAPPANDNPMQ